MKRYKWVFIHTSDNGMSTLESQFKYNKPIEENKLISDLTEDLKRYKPTAWWVIGASIELTKKLRKIQVPK